MSKCEGNDRMTGTKRMSSKDARRVEWSHAEHRRPKIAQVCVEASSSLSQGTVSTAAVGRICSVSLRSTSDGVLTRRSVVKSSLMIPLSSARTNAACQTFCARLPIRGYVRCFAEAAGSCLHTPTHACLWSRDPGT